MAYNDPYHKFGDVLLRLRKEITSENCFVYFVDATHNKTIFVRQQYLYEILENKRIKFTENYSIKEIDLTSEMEDWLEQTYYKLDEKI